MKYIVERLKVLSVMVFVVVSLPSVAGDINPSYNNNEYHGPDNNCPKESTRNPIHIGSSSKYHEEDLFRGGGEFPLAFTFFYNSRYHRAINTD